MPKITRNAKKKFARMERGQVLVVVALSAIGVIAIIGLAIDIGLMFIGNARLRRAVDAAALSAALQYRQSADIGLLTHAATEFLTLNGAQVDSVTVDTCVTDTTLCTTPRKLVRVHAIAEVKLAFLPVIGINSATISATAVSEAASLDVILVIDRSESMTYGDKDTGKHDVGDPMRDPSYCNGISFTDTYGYSHTSSCQPFDKVTTAAIGFANSLFYPYDYVAVVTFDKEPHLDLSLVDSSTDAGHTKAEVIDVLRQLTVYQGADSYNHASSTTDDYRCYDFPNDQCAGPGSDICTTAPILGSGSNYQGLIGKGQDPCPSVNPDFVNPPDPTHYTTTNIGGGLDLAGNELATDRRQQTLWVVILLTDGVANAGYGGSDPDNPSYYCPESTWGNLSLKTSSGVSDPLPLCNHGDPTFRNPKNDSSYDASDYAYDMADFVGKAYPNGQGALLYTIGLGNELLKYTRNTGSYPDPYSSPIAGTTGEGLGTIFLNYAAHVGNGQAFYAATGADLDKIFQLIGSNIATRLSQ